MKDCSGFNESHSLFDSYNITHGCALFDFYVYTVAAGTCCILGVAGNIVSFTVLWRDNSKTATAFLLRALAVADTLVLITAALLYSASYVHPYTGYMGGYNTIHSIIMPYLWPAYLMAYTGTIFLTVLVSLNRYFAVCRPFNSNKMCSTEQAKKHVLIVAFVAVIYNIPRFFEYKTVDICISNNASKTVFDLSDFGNNLIYRIVYSNILYFIVMHGGPLLSLAFLNVKLIKALKKRQKKRAEMGHGGYQQDITLVLIVVICVFMFCQTPTFIDHILWTAVDPSYRTCGHWHYYYTAISDSLAVLNSSVNFLIYILTSRKFRTLLITTCSQQQDLLRFQSQNHTNAAENITLMSHANNNHAVNVPPTAV